MGNSITLINNQFYNNHGWDGTSALDIHWYETIAKTTEAPKLILGMPVGPNSASEGYLPPSQLISEVIQPLRTKFGADFGGVMGWELADDTDGCWGVAIGDALGLKGQPV